MTCNVAQLILHWGCGSPVEDADLRLDILQYLGESCLPAEHYKWKLSQS